jgi:ribonuclease VapC
MFIDASALLAILLKEPDAQRFSREIENAERLYTSPVAIFEMVLAVVRERALPRLDAQRAVDRALQIAGVEVIPITGEIGNLALAAFEKFGKGRGHSARLNMGDCFAYACAKSLGVPLLYKGNDFAKTDLA